MGRTWAQPASSLILATKVLFVAPYVGDVSFTAFSAPQIHSIISLNISLEFISGVIVQYSTNNGVQWEFLRELEFGSFLEPQMVTIELPPLAKTPYTVFRWWQSEQGKKFTAGVQEIFN